MTSIAVSDELRQAIIDPDLYFRNFVKILDKHRSIVPFRLKPAQTHFLNVLKARRRLYLGGKGLLRGRDFVLKSRKLGFSTEILNLMAWEAMTVPNTVAATVSHETKATQRLLEIVKRTHSNLPVELRPPVERDSKYEFTFPSIGSKIYIGTAGSLTFGRGDTPNLVHLSEYASYGELEVPEIMSGLTQSLESKDSWIVVETTPKGRNHAYDLYKEAKSGESPFQAHFYPWWWEEVGEITLPEGHPLAPESCRGDFDLTSEEEKLILAHNLTKEHIRWRRYKQKELQDTAGSAEYFKQEYPETDWDCFLVASEGSVFPVGAIALYRGDVRAPTYREENGLVLIWKKPEIGAKYIMSADPSEGLETSTSRSSVVFVNTRNSEHVAVIRGRIDPDRLGMLMAQYGDSYNKAAAIVERNNHGHAVLAKLKSLGYSPIYEEEGKLGWLTTEQKKRLILDELIAAIRDRSIVTYDEGLVQELAEFHWRDGKPVKPTKGWDDTLMAMAIAWHNRYCSVGSGYGKPLRIGRW